MLKGTLQGMNKLTNLLDKIQDYSDKSCQANLFNDRMPPTTPSPKIHNIELQVSTAFTCFLVVAPVLH